MIYSNNQLFQQQQTTSLLLVNEEAKMSDWNDRLLLPSSTRSLKRRTSLLEKSRDWARRLITLHRPRRNTISNGKLRVTYDEKPEMKSNTTLLHNYQKSFDEDGYLSPLEIKATLDDIPREKHPSHSKLSMNSYSNSNISPMIYRYHDPNIPTKSSPCPCQQVKRLPTTSFASEFQKSLSIVDYIDLDVPDDLLKHDDDPLESLKYLFNNHSKQQQQQQGNLSRRIPRRTTNASSISTDSGYSDQAISSTSKLHPVHLISCSLIPVNVRYVPCTCRSSSSSSTTCLTNSSERKFYSHSSRTQLYRPPLSQMNQIENGIKHPCVCNPKSHSTMTIYPSTLTTKFSTTNEEQKEEFGYKRPLKKKRASLMRHPSITDDLMSISRWYKPYLEREAVCNFLQQADYGAFILRNSTTHSDCYALSIKVPKFTHDSNIVHYLIEKTIINDTPSYRIKGTIKQFPTLLSLLTHHSVMPEILPITLNLNESYI